MLTGLCTFCIQDLIGALRCLWAFTVFWIIIQFTNIIFCSLFRCHATPPDTIFSASSIPLSCIIAGGSSATKASETLLSLLRREIPSLFRSDAGFSGVWWLPNGHAQTIYTILTGSSGDKDDVLYERTTIRLQDGGTLALDVTPPFIVKPLQHLEPILLVTHGLTGGSNESYVRAALHRLTAPPSQGGLSLRAVVLNSRGCNCSPVTSPQLYHAGTTDDIRHTVLWIAHNFPQSPIFALGFSLGANALTKYAGEEGESCPLSAIVSVANVFDFVEGSYHIEHGSIFTRFIYNNALGGALRSLLYTHRHAFENIDSSQLQKSTMEQLFRRYFVSLRAYDESITTALYGFYSVNDYYADVSSSRFISRIRVPFLGLNAKDDPIVGSRTLPLCEALASPWVILARTEGGGHLGWFERATDGSLRRWYVAPVCEFFKAMISCKLAPRPPVHAIAVEDSIYQAGRGDIGFSLCAPGPDSRTIACSLSPSL